MSIPQSGGGPNRASRSAGRIPRVGLPSPRKTGGSAPSTRNSAIAATPSTRSPMMGSARSRRFWKGCSTSSDGRRCPEGGNIIGLNQGRRQCQPGTGRAAGGCRAHRWRGNDPPDLRRGERTPARSARGGGRHRVEFIGLAPSPIWRARGHAADAQGPLQAEWTATCRRVGTIGNHHDAGAQLHGAGEPGFRVRGRHGWQQECGVALALAPRGDGSLRQFALLGGKPKRPQILRFRVLARSRWRAPHGMLPFVFRAAASASRPGCSNVLDVPIIFVYRDGAYINALGHPYRGISSASCPRACGRRSHAERLGRPPDHVFPRATGEELHRDARTADGGPWRRLCRAAGVLVRA